MISNRRFTKDDAYLSHFDLRKYLALFVISDFQVKIKMRYPYIPTRID